MLCVFFDALDKEEATLALGRIHSVHSSGRVPGHPLDALALDRADGLGEAASVHRYAVLREGAWDCTSGSSSLRTCVRVGAFRFLLGHAAGANTSRLAHRTLDGLLDTGAGPVLRGQEVSSSAFCIRQL